MTLGLYLSTIVGTRILLSWFVLLLLALSIDLLQTAGGLINRGGVSLVAHYAWLRLPLLGTILLPISALTGAILAFLMLSSRSELTVIRAAGLSMWRILAILGPLALVLGILHHLMGDNLSTWAQDGLSELFPLEVPGSTASMGERVVWLREGNNVIRAIPLAEDGSVLTDLTVYRLDPNGELVDRLIAETATYRGDLWELTSAIRRTDGEVLDLGSHTWNSRMTPTDIFSVADGRRDRSLEQVRAVLAGDAVPTRGQAYYQTRIVRSYIAYAVPGIMLLIAGLSAFGTARHGGGVKMAVLAVVLGFLYIAIDGFVVSLGEAGAIGPFIAAALPSGVVLMAAIWFLLLQEG